MNEFKFSLLIAMVVLMLSTINLQAQINLEVEGDAIISNDLGVGVDNPGARVHIKASGASITSGIRFETSQTTFEDWYLYMNATDDLSFRNDADDFLIIQKNTGHLGVGTIDPGASLHVVGTGSEIARFEGTGSKWISLYDSEVRKGMLWSVGNDIVLRADDALGEVRIQTEGNNDRMTVNATGVGIGTTSPSAKLDVIGVTELHGDLEVDTDALFVDASANRVGIRTSTPGYTLDLEHSNFAPNVAPGNGLNIRNNGSDPTDHWTFYVSSSTDDLRLYWTETIKGAFDEATGNYSPLSDRRFKTNITPVEDNMLNKIRLLKPARYHIKSKAGGHKEYGLIAQEVQKVFPELTPVLQSTAEGADRNLLGVTYTEFVPILIKAIQEQQEIIEQQQENIKKMQENIEALQKKVRF